jgi:hypothetical protein
MEIKRLQDMFPPAVLEWRIQRSGKKDDGKVWARVVPYIDSRAIMDRLDEVCGPENWQNQYNPGFAGGILCGIGIKVDGEWVWKYDGAEIVPEDEDGEKKGKNRIDPLKSSFTNAFKRAAVQWGIGRYLYSIQAGWAVFCDNGIYSAKIDGRTYNWNPPALPGTDEQKKNEPPEKNPSPSPRQTQPNDYARMRDEIWAMCLELVDGVEEDAVKILHEVAGIRVITALIPKNAPDVFARLKARCDERGKR